MSVDDRPAIANARRLLCDRYRLGALIGEGGAGRVHEAFDVMLGRPVAVKMFHAGGNAIGRDRFAEEARLLAGLSHPALVTIYDVCLDGDEPFLVMRLVDGPTLRDLLDRGPLEPAAVARIGARLTGALAYVHARNIVHRDIKPSNVLVDDVGDCHLTDFGVARALNSAHLTVSGEFVGTAAYLAPEQITDIDVGPAADIYALGLMLLECLTGHTEYTGTTIETALARLKRQPRIPESLPSPWHTLLTAMTAQDPAARPDAGRCAEVLTAIVRGHTAPSTRPLVIPEQRQAVRSRLPRPRPVHAGVTALALAAVCAVAASTGTTVSGQPTSEPRTVTPPAVSTTIVPSTEPVVQATPPVDVQPVDVQGAAVADPQTQAAPAKGKSGEGGHGKEKGGSGKSKGKGKGKG